MKHTSNVIIDYENDIVEYMKLFMKEQVEIKRK